MTTLLAGLLSGHSVTVLVASLIAFVSGIAGVAVVLDHRENLKRISTAYQTSLTALQSAASKNREIVGRYQGIKDNFDCIVENALEEINKEYSAAIALAEQRAGELDIGILNATETVRSADSRVIAVIERFLNDTQGAAVETLDDDDN